MTTEWKKIVILSMSFTSHSIKPLESLSSQCMKSLTMIIAVFNTSEIYILDILLKHDDININKQSTKN